MSNGLGNTATPLWRNRRLWLIVWLTGTAGLLALLLWDAWPWLSDAPQASFRNTRLNEWPLEVIWWLLVPGILWLQVSLMRIDRHWLWAIGLHGLTAALITGLFIILQAARVLLANHLPASFLPVVVNDLRWLSGWSYLPALVYLALILALYAVAYYREWRAGQRLTGELRVANASSRPASCAPASTR